jgi:hypothetical protein
MPPAKRSTSSTTRRTSTRRTSSQAKTLTATSRAQLEKAVKRLEKSLDDARDALTSLGSDVSHGGHRTYKDLGGALKSVRSDAQKANRTLTKELEKLRAAATPGRSTSSRSTGTRKTTTRSSTARKAKGTARKTSSSAKSTARSGARKATGTRSRRSS